MPRRTAPLRAIISTLILASLVAGAAPAQTAAVGPDARVPGSTRGTTAVPAEPEVRPGEYLVEFVPAERPAARKGVHTAVGARLLGRGRGASARYDLVRADRGVGLEELRRRYEEYPGVVRIQPNFVYRSARIPNDPLFTQQWPLFNFGQTLGTAGADIGAPEAWDVTTGSSDVVVAVIDSGVERTHPDLAANTWVNTAEQNGAPGVDDDGNGYVDDVYGWDFLGRDNDPSAGTDSAGSHGTYVAGVVSAVGDNGIGVAGVSWRTRIMSLRFISATLGDTYHAIQAIDYAAANGADIINASWGAHIDLSNMDVEDVALKAAIERAGIPFVAAAGNVRNDHDDPNGVAFIPAAFSSQNIIAVAATDHDDDLWFDPGDGSGFGAASVDLGAPGVDVVSTGVDGKYGKMTGTSLAAPHVTGAAALALAVNPHLTTHQLKRLLLSSVRPVDGVGGAVSTQGRLDAAAAVGMALQPPVASVERLSGVDRYDAAVTIAQDAYPGLAGVDSVVVASGEDRAAADPLSASGLVWALDGAPMLLVSASKVPATTRAAVSAIGSGATGTLRVFVVGGTMSIPEARLAELREAAGARPVEFVRVAGADRYATAEEVAKRMRAERPFEMPRRVLVANGEDPSKFFDALALSPISARTGAPIALVRRDSVPAATRRTLNLVNPTLTIAAGGPATVSSGVVSELSAARWWGSDRYSTASTVAHNATAAGWLSANDAFLAAKLPDALAGGATVGHRGGVLLLTERDGVPSATRSWLSKRSGVVDRVRVLGGTQSIATKTQSALAPMIR